MTLPRRSRLLGRNAFSGVFKQAVVSADGNFKVLAQISEQRCSRLGISVSRKVDRRAVQRNRLKRIIRESFRLHYSPDKQQTPLDIVVLPRQTAVAAPRQELMAQLARHWVRIDQRAAERARQTNAALPTAAEDKAGQGH